MILKKTLKKLEYPQELFLGRNPKVIKSKITLSDAFLCLMYLLVVISSCKPTLDTARYRVMYLQLYTRKVSSILLVASNSFLKFPLASCSAELVGDH
ncbi:hypothetical protein Tco_0902310 [Tanacetum coccineum]